MKRIYFVRHGITGGNETNSYQHLNTPLSDKGRVQANFLAERLSKISFDVLIASTMERAQETARVIAAKTGHEVVYESLFQERLMPSVVRGRPHQDPEVLEIVRIAKSHWTTEGVKHSDEENFHDLKKRALQALDFLMSRPEETMVVVTHGTILCAIVAAMMRGERTDPDFLKEISHFFYMENTGITWVEYDSKHRPGRWELITWNDHAHLG